MHETLINVIQFQNSISMIDLFVKILIHSRSPTQRVSIRRNLNLEVAPRLAWHQITIKVDLRMIEHLEYNSKNECPDGIEKKEKEKKESTFRTINWIQDWPLIGCPLHNYLSYARDSLKLYSWSIWNVYIRIKTPRCW